MSKLLGHLRKLALLGALGAAGWTWADTLKFSWASNEWTGLWSAVPELRGKPIPILVHDVETTEEREKRTKQVDTGVADDLRGVKRNLLGDQSKTRGNDIHAAPGELPPGYADYTQREVCMQQKLEFPERFQDLDCMSDKYDDVEPFLEAPTRPGTVDTP